MAEENNPQKPSISSDSRQQDPPPLPTSCSQKSKNEDPETTRESKRRRNCPRALDQIHESTHANFAFTFDTKFVETAQESTPKFGSFSLLLPTKQQDRQFFQSPALKDKEEAVAAEEDWKVELAEDKE